MIRTVCGDCPPEALGHCQCHEHLFIAKGQSYRINPALWMDDTEASLAEVQLYKAAGGCSLVDAQPLGAGRMPEALLEAARRSGVNIVASTGFHKLCFYEKDHWIHSATEQELAERFLSDIHIGMSGDAVRPHSRCSARAGVIKCALDENGLQDEYKRLFRAAAKAALQSGAPMLIHTEDGMHALELIRFLQELGVSSERIILCHIERSMERMEEKLRIAATGVYLQCDTIARYKYHSDEDEALFLRRLCDNGHEDRILLGLDTTRQRLKSYGGKTGLDEILVGFIPLLRRHAFSESQLMKFCIRNPAVVLSMNAK